MPKFPKTGVCALCKKTSELKLSHIIPAAAHRHTKIEGRNVLSNYEEGRLNVKNQSDFKEYLLCETCETIFSIFENDAMTSLQRIWKSQPDTYLKIPQSNIPALNRFIRSVFWRASASENLKFKMPPEAEEKLRSHLNGETSLEFPEMATRIANFPIANVYKKSNMILTPSGKAFGGESAICSFSIFGLLLCMSSPHALFMEKEEDFLNPSTGMGVVNSPYTFEQIQLQNYFENLHAQGRAHLAKQAAKENINV